MRRAIFTAVAAVTTLTVACGTAGSSPSTRPSTSPAATPSPSASAEASIDPATWVEFSSPRHGYALRHPAEWEVTPATGRWGRNAISFPGSPALDHLRGEGVTFVAASQPIPEDSSDETWMADYVALIRAADPECGRPREEWEPIVIDGRDGLTVETCETFAIVTAGGRGYEFRMLGDANPELYAALLEGITLEPDRADDS